MADSSCLGKRAIRIISAVFFLYASAAALAQPSPPVIMAHYMPWYQTPAHHGYWGWHWTMNHFNPDSIDRNGYRQIASHFYPLTGPYDSGDTLILEYQTLLMKAAGIDGILADWYGNANFLDYGLINTGTLAAMKAAQKARLKFGLVFEDNIFAVMKAQGFLSADTAARFAKRMMQYAGETFFSSSNYKFIGNRPVLLNFGPRYFTQSAQWDTLFSVFTVKPLFFTEDFRLAPVAAGAYPWTPMSLSNPGGVLQQSTLIQYLNQFYQQSAAWSHVIGTAFPGFRDIYQQAGVHASYGYLDALGGATFRLTLDRAMQRGPDIIQIQTWNDYGEGTIIEPTAQFGTRYLEMIRALKDSLDPAFPFQPSDLVLPHRLYQARIQFKGNAAKNAVMNRVFEFFISGQPAPAALLLDSLLGASSAPSDANTLPQEMELMQNFPNPFNPVTRIKYSVISPQSTVNSRKSSDNSRQSVNLKVFDVLGREVATLVNEEKSAGSYSVSFNASMLPSGTYFYELRAGDFREVKKMILLR